MTTLRISPDVWRHTRAFQETLEEGRAEGRAEGQRGEASTLTLRQLERRCGSLSPKLIARIEALDLPQLEELALALLDFHRLQDLTEWLQRLRRQG